MDLKLNKVVLWPKNPENPVREVPFEPAGVSVITGWSQKGKSALIHIIDYCLGSRKCAIPVGEVRDKVAWFGVQCHLPRKRQLLIARKNPGEQVQSAEMVLLEGANIVVPRDIESAPKMGHAAVLKRLNLLAGLPSHEIAEEEAGYSGPPSFRDMAAFQFQPQHIIANPHTLFFKADTAEHREKLIRSVLPYVLGAVDANTLEAQAQLRQAEAELNVTSQQLEQARRAGAMWLPKLEHLYAVARDHNLVPNAPAPESAWTSETYRSLLRTVSTAASADEAMQVPRDATRQIVREIVALREESSRLSRTIQLQRRKLEKIQAVRSAAGGYIASLQEQSTRLAPVGWFADHVRDSDGCPLCGHESPAARKAVEQLAAVGTEISSKLAVLPGTSESLEAEAVGLEKSISEAKASQRQIEGRLHQWNSYSEEMTQLSNRRDFISKFTGQLGAALESIEAGSDVSQLAQDAKTLEDRVKRLRATVNEPAIREKTQQAISSISRAITFYADVLKIEHASRAWQLDPKSLTLQTADEGERTDYLWEIGSAANWMGYHIATLLALHEHFRSVKQNPVPKFLILDQPSQAFFPEGITAARQGRGKTSPQRLSDDLARLKRLFEALSKAITRTKNGLQIIVLEHAEASVWAGVDNVKQVAEWRDGDALVPLSWK